MYKVIIIDDELRARNLLKGLIQEYCPDLSVTDMCEDLPSGVKSIRKNKPDLVLLDIEMPGYSGLELLDFFDEDDIDFSVIFTTAYSEFAIQAFKLSAIDYLLKPIEPSDLEQAIERFKRQRNQHNQDWSQLVALKTGSYDKIGVPTSNGFRFVDLNEITHLKAQNSYTELFLVSGEKLLLCRTLKNFDEMLAANSFFLRCHKSYIININFAEEFTRSNGGFVLMKDKTEIPISQDKQSELLEKIMIVRRN